jgi:hypothetical protein
MKPKPKFIIIFEELLKPLEERSAPVTGINICWSPPVTGIGRVGTTVEVAVEVGVEVDGGNPTVGTVEVTVAV